MVNIFLMCIFYEDKSTAVETFIVHVKQDERKHDDLSFISL